MRSRGKSELVFVTKMGRLSRGNGKRAEAPTLYSDSAETEKPTVSKEANAGNDDNWWFVKIFRATIDRNIKQDYILLASLMNNLGE